MKLNPAYQTRTLAECLSNQGRTQRWLAARVGIHEASLSRIVAGKQTTTEANAQRIADILGVPIFVLFDVLVGPKNVTISIEAIPA